MFLTKILEVAEFPWLLPEKQFLFKTIQRGVSVLGVCLDSQVIARALGSRIFYYGRGSASTGHKAQRQR